MKFGFGANPAVHYTEYIELVKLAENLGFSFAWVPDQTFFRDPYVILTALANATKRILLGIGVTNPNTRHPAMAARAIASIDEIVPGRVSLGIGAGNNKELLNPLGLEVAHAGEKCREMALIVRALLSGEVVQYRGLYTQALGVKMDFAANPDIPIYIAGRGPRVLQAAGEVADGAIIGGLCSPRGIAYALEQVNTGAKKIDRQLERFEIVSWVTVNITDQRENAMEELKPIVAHIIGGAPEIVLESSGLDPALVHQIKNSYKESILQAARFVSPECIDAFTIVGDKSECVQRIEEIDKAGITQLAMLMPPGSIEQQKQYLINFSEAIISHF